MKKISAKSIDAFILSAIAQFRSGALKAAETLRKAHPGIANANVITAAMLGEDRRVAAMLQAQPELATAAAGPKGWPPLLYLCFSRYVRLRPRRAAQFARCAKLLLDHRADPNCFWMEKDSRETALYGAAGIANCAPLTKVLLDAGATPDEPDHETLYHVAEFRDHACLKLVLAKMPRNQMLSYCMAHKLDMEDPAGLRLFLRRGADPNFLKDSGTAMAGMRPLHFAILRHRSGKVIQTLIAGGADSNLPDRNGVTPLAMARRFGNLEAARALRAAGAIDNPTPREAAIAAVMAGDAKRAAQLIPDPAAFAESLSADDQKLLPLATEAGNLPAIQLMLDLGWNIETPGNWHGTALHQAIYHGHLNLVRYLLSRGANVRHKNAFGGEAFGAALHAAVNEPHPDSLKIVKLMAQQKRNKNLTKHIKWAEQQGHPRLANLLRRLQAQPA